MSATQAERSGAQETPWPMPIWDANTVELTAQDLGNGAHAVVATTAEAETAQGIPQPTSGGIVAGTNAAMVIESMMTPRLARQMLELAGQVTGKPIRYVGNTVDHGDHYFGNYLMPESALIIQHEVTRRRLEAAGIEALKEQQMGWFDRGKGIEGVQYRPADLLVGEGGRLVVDLGGGTTVEVIDMGIGQSPGDLWFWVPGAKVIYAGNAFIAERPSIPWLLDGVARAPATTLRKVYEWLPDDAKVVPGHGRVTDKAGMRFFVEYTEALVAAVTDAVERGRSLEQTRAEVTMPDFDAGYPLFGWLHFDVNIPTAYKEAVERRRDGHVD